MSKFVLRDLPDVKNLQLSSYGGNNVYQKFSLDNMIPYTMSLLNDPGRVKNISSHLKTHIPNLKIWVGVDGNTTEFDTMVESGYITANYRENGRIGALGCAMGFLTLCLHFLASDYQHLLFVEDDVTLVDNFLDRLTNGMTKIPVDYDYVQLFNRGENPKSGNHRQWMSVLANPRNRHCPGIIKGIATVGNQGMCISRKGATRMLGNMLPLNEPIDNSILNCKILERYSLTKGIVRMQYKFSSGIWTTTNKLGTVEIKDSKNEMAKRETDSTPLNIYTFEKLKT
jgi:GR25 family glycosyltransferase involved in LPS biosynthesis